MIRISIVPDTNIFIDRLEVVRRLYEEEFPVELSLSIPKVVLGELDHLKKESYEARSAIRFLEEIIGRFDRAELEGAKNDSVMDMVGGPCVIDEVKNNDDRIIRFASERVNPVILTNDKALYLKTKAYSIKSIMATGLSYDDIKYQILGAYTHIERMDVIEHDQPSSSSAIKDRVRNKLFPVVIQIMEKHLGKPYVLFFPDNPQDADLGFLVSLIIKEYYIFQSYIPRSSKKILEKIRMDMEKAEGEELKGLGSKLLMLFRICY
jgi:rRNA-processing protein FCF1